MLKAGFSESRPAGNSRKRKPKRRQARRDTTQAADAAREADAARLAEQERRKAAKREIQALIEAHAIKDFAGEHAWHYQVDARIRQAFVSESVRQRLVDGQLVLTRLNGASYVIPSDTGEAILAINPDWVVFRQRTSSDDGDGEYADFPVPDDLQW